LLAAREVVMALGPISDGIGRFLQLGTSLEGRPVSISQICHQHLPASARWPREADERSNVQIEKFPLKSKIVLRTPKTDDEGGEKSLHGAALYGRRRVFLLDSGRSASPSKDYPSSVFQLAHQKGLQYDSVSY
jgi:hypothetical protein